MITVVMTIRLVVNMVMMSAVLKQVGMMVVLKMPMELMMVVMTTVMMMMVFGSLLLVQASSSSSSSSSCLRGLRRRASPVS